LLPVPQLVGPGTVEPRPMLPSYLYAGTAEEAAAGTLDLPWARRRDWAVGAFARRQAADVPARTVAATKSWLAYPRVDRRQPILPWGAPAEVTKVSPVEASRRFLEHLVAVWTAAVPDAPLERQQVVLTVPASFDASARELTREAALGVQLDAWQSVALWHACRDAKEALLDEDGPATHPVTVLGRGTRVVGGAVSVDVDRKTAVDLLLNGFFPACGLGERPATRQA